jgi:Zn-dependent protease
LIYCAGLRIKKIGPVHETFSAFEPSVMCFVYCVGNQQGKNDLEIDFARVALQYICLLFSLSVHECAHAAMANYCGDPSARLLGRMTLNPVKHAHPIGTVVLPLLMMITNIPYLFGFAKPVPYNPRNLNDIQRDPVLIGLAGPAANLALTLLAALILRMVAVMYGVMPDSPVILIMIQFFSMLILINLILMLFNLIPIPPLDGHHVLHYFLPPSGQKKLEQIGPFGIIIVIVLVQQVGILTVPFRIANLIIMYIAFWGTPVWDLMAQ